MAATSAHTVTSEHPVCAKCAEPYLPKGGKPSAVTLCYHCWRMLIITLWLVTTVRTSPPPEHTHYAALHHTHHDKQQFNGEQNHRAPLSPQSSVILPVLHNVCLSPCMCARVRVLTSRMNVQQDIRRARARARTQTHSSVSSRGGLFWRDGKAKTDERTRTEPHSCSCRSRGNNVPESDGPPPQAHRTANSCA